MSEKKQESSRWFVPMTIGCGLMSLLYAFWVLPINTEWGEANDVRNYWPQSLLGIALLLGGIFLLLRAHVWRHRYYYLAANLFAAVISMAGISFGGFVWESDWSTLKVAEFGAHWIVLVALLASAVVSLVLAWKEPPSNPSDEGISRIGKVLLILAAMFLLAVPIAIKASEWAVSEDQKNLLRNASVEFELNGPRQVWEPADSNRSPSDETGTLDEAERLLVDGTEKVPRFASQKPMLDHVTAWWIDSRYDAFADGKYTASITVTPKRLKRTKRIIVTCLRSDHFRLNEPDLVRALLYDDDGAPVAEMELKRDSATSSTQLTYVAEVRPSVVFGKLIIEASVSKATVHSWGGVEVGEDGVKHGRGGFAFIEIIAK